MAEATQEELQVQVTQLTTDLATATQDKATLQDQLTSERTRSGELAGELNEAENLIEDLQKRLKTSEAVQAQSDVAIVTDGTHHYKLLAPKFKFRHVDYTAAELKGDEQLVRELVAAGVGLLQPLETGA